MRKVTLFIAVSLDGYIADEHGGVDWLNEHSVDGEGAYSTFIQTVDTVLMGWNTYYQITTELAPGEWPYAGLKSYVVTHRNMPAEKGIVFSRESPCDIIHRLKQGAGKDIWVCGGADVVRQLLKEDLIDQFDISVMPTVLGAGIRLFSAAPGAMALELISMRNCGGIPELVYRRRRERDAQ